jgi:hypothetical protein
MPTAFCKKLFGRTEATLLKDLITMNLLQNYRQTGMSVNKLGPEGCVTE